jgi:hypothetical protein
MSFLIYFFVLRVSAGTVLFGLDLVNSPLHPPPNVPIGRTVRQVGPTPPAREVRDVSAKEASARSETKAEARKQPTAADGAHGSAPEQAQAENGSLSPVYPASPGPAAPVITTGKANADETQAAASNNDGGASNEQDATTETAQADSQQAKAPNACNVQACGAAYRSFRASDCTYQPYDGPRRLCTKSGSGTMSTTAESSPRQHAQPPARRAARRDELDEVSRVVRGMPAGEAARVRGRHADELSEAARIVRRMTRGRSLGDVAVRLGDGRIVIVHTGDPLAE